MIGKNTWIFWDWNGTLLDDVEICIRSMNQMLARRKKEPLSLERYHEIFQFPVEEYYNSIGFDFGRESFEEVSLEFISNYQLLLPAAPLFNSVREVLDFFYQRDIQQVILSAMEQNALVSSLKERGIYKYFSCVIGLDNHYTESKIMKAVRFVNEQKIDPHRIVLIGDTTHDHEVAKTIGARCILISGGHQPRAKLIKTGAVVEKELKNILGFVSIP